MDVLFIRREDAENVCTLLEHYALQEDGDEPGAKEHRFKAVTIDRSKGTAAGYVAKYISKNIDGHALDTDLYGNDAKKAAQRVDTWASTWGIRQFQQIGGPPVSIWRELRRLKPEDYSQLLGQLVQAADSGDWSEFVQLMGGVSVPRDAQPVKILRVWCDKSGRYGEPVGYQVQGVSWEGVEVVTRIHIWEIFLKRSSKSSPPWSSVNYCTETG